MTATQHETRPRAPWDLWVVGILALLWNAMGALDYLMTETKNAAYMSKFTPEQLAYFYGLPAWVVSTWAIAVWGAVLASLLLLFRRALAYWVFVVSFVALLITFFRNYVLADGLKLMGGVGPMIFSAVIVLVAILLILYSAAQKKRGVLR